MPSEAEQLVIEVLRACGTPLSLPEMRRALREKGRNLSEDLLLRTCTASSVIRGAGAGRFALLSQIVDEIAPPEDTRDHTSLDQVTLSQLPALRRGSYITVDLETTGTDPTSDAIIQVGAVRVEEGRIIGTFFEPVNPGYHRLTAALRRVLHIPEGERMDRLIQQAPQLSEVLPRFFDFIGDRLLIAHNGCGLDFPFLTQHGLSATHPVLDSLELAYLAWPSAPSHGLETLAAACGLPEGAPAVIAITQGEPRVAGVGHHNALYDAAVLHLVVQQLLARLDHDIQTGSLYGCLLQSLLPDLFSSETAVDSEFLDSLRAALTPTGFPERNQTTGRHTAGPSSASETRQRFQEYVFRSGSQVRHSQAEMVDLVANTLTQGGIRLIEAPTGTGKSLGLAFPAAVHAVATGERVLLSTYTRNLQDQLEADLNSLEVHSGLPFRSCVLKGRGNYLCVTSLYELLRDALNPGEPETLLLDERVCLTVLAGWALHQAASAAEGDLDTIPYPLRSRFRTMELLVAAVCGERSRCREDRCHSSRGCYRAQARARAQAADLLVVNHALWLSPALDGFPPFGGLLLDEAHELEDAATSALSEEVSDKSLQSLLAEILTPGDRRGLLVRLLRRATPEGKLHSQVRAAFGAVRLVRAEVLVFGRELVDFLRRIGLDPAAEHGAVYRLRAEGRREHPTRWRALARAGQTLSHALGDLARGLAAVAAAATEEPACTVFEAEVSFLAEQVAAVRTTLDIALHNGDRRYVTWFEAKVDAPDAEPRDLQWAVRRAPVTVADALRSRFRDAGAVVLTSATLTIRGGDFGFLMDRLGLTGEVGSDRLHRLPGAFDYRNAVFVMPRYLDHAPQGSSLPFFVQELAEELRILFSFTEGRGLVLFTARTRMEEVYQRIEHALGRLGIVVHAQTPGASREALRREFAEDEHSVLLGLKSFWQGVDVPGSACSVVVIEKLPFPAFGDPLTDARREAVAAAGGAEFEDYLLPLALLGFKQGFGRLLRAPEDRGVVLLMDRRIHSRSYKADLLQSLPGYTRRPEVEDSRRESYRVIADHLPALFTGRDLPSLLAALPDVLLSEVAALVAAWDLPPVLGEDEYEEQRAAILAFMERVFGFAHFRGEEQEQIVRAVLCGRDVIGLLPTGAGKSLTFQLPALLRQGLTLVVSPLIALMRDQVEKLHALRLDMVDAITSHMSAGEREEVLRRARAGRLRLLYVSPERLRDPQLQATLQACQVVQVVVDEAHCISLWGPTFRPEYVGIAPALATLSTRPPISALTATATPEIRDDIAERLALREPLIIQGSFDRPEIRYLVYDRQSRVHPIRSANDKFRMAVLLARTAERRREPMIIYTATTRTAEDVARKLSALGFSAKPYHGQMPADERSEVQELFIDDHINVVVATKAFGMGIDKPDIRSVVHYDVPGDVESYLQESGRAGRDGNPAFAVLLFHPSDLGIQRFFIESLRMGSARLQPLMHTLCPYVEARAPLDLATLAVALDQEEHLLRIALYRLEEAGWLVPEGDVVTDASVTILEDEDVLYSAGLPDDIVIGVQTLLATGRLPICRRVTVSLPDLASVTGLRIEEVEQIFITLALQGLATYRPFARSIRVAPGPRFSDPDLQHQLADPLVERKYAKLENMIAYAQNRRTCRRQFLLRYLGETDAPGRCAGCDVCRPDLAVPWAHERMADVPNPSQLFDPHAVALALIEANVARAAAEGRSPLGWGTLKCILLGNAYPVLQREPDPFLRKWKDRRLRSFSQWGLLASLPKRESAIDDLFRTLLAAGLVDEVQTQAEGDVSYTFLRPTSAGYRALVSGEPLNRAERSHAV